MGRSARSGRIRSLDIIGDVKVKVSSVTVSCQVTVTYTTLSFSVLLQRFDSATNKEVVT